MKWPLVTVHDLQGLQQPLIKSEGLIYPAGWIVQLEKERRNGVGGDGGVLRVGGISQQQK